MGLAVRSPGERAARSRGKRAGRLRVRRTRARRLLCLAHRAGFGALLVKRPCRKESVLKMNDHSMVYLSIRIAMRRYRSNAAKRVFALTPEHLLVEIPVPGEKL
jgi:hypothetical protein